MTRPAKVIPFFLSLLSGVLLWLAFPKADLEALAWISFVPLLVILEQSPPKRGFLYGLIAGLSFYLGSLYWVTHAMTFYGGLSRALSLMVLIALSFYLSCYFGVFSWVCCRFQLLSRGWGVLWLPSLWVSLEYLRNFLLSGFPWNLVGYSQYRNAYFLQLASLGGIYGLSFLVLLVNSGFAFAFLHSPRSLLKLKILSCVGIAVVLALGYGSFRLHRPLGGEAMRVGLVQGNIDQSLKWNPAFQRASLDVHKRLTLGAARARPEMIIWPETALAFYLRTEPRWREELESLARQIGCYLLVGSPDYAAEGKSVRYYNSAFLLSPEKGLVEKYDKMHLVPFGEYVPLRRFLPFVDKLVVGVGDFSAGQEVKILKVPKGRFGVTICFETIFPEIAREYRRRGADFLVNLTNDAWFGETAAPYQHLSMAVVRAVENGCYLVRAANTGISGVISPYGEIVRASRLFSEDRFTADISLSPRITPYARMGDVLAWSCVLVSLIFIPGPFYLRGASLGLKAGRSRRR